MSDFLARVHSSDVVGLVALLLTFVVVMVLGLCYQWRAHRRTELELNFKREMVERGISAQDIERIIGARSSETGRFFARNHKSLD
jgi:hypothetical protein